MTIKAEKNSPAVAATTHGAAMEFVGSITETTTALFEKPQEPKSFVVHWITRNCGVSTPVANQVAQLAGLKGANDQWGCS